MVESYSRILVRATNWVGDAVLSLPALAALRRRFPAAHIAVLARPWVADLYRYEPCADEVVPYQPGAGLAGWGGRRVLAARLREMRFDCALLLPNSFDSALVPWAAGIPRRIGYARDARRWLLTDAIARPAPGAIPAHESYYYLELLRRAGWLDSLPATPQVRLHSAPRARAAGRAWLARQGLAALIGVSPGAAYGNAKRWLPERFAEAAATLAREHGAAAALFGSPAERALCEAVAALIAAGGVRALNYAGATSLGEYIERAAACLVYLTNDSGAMHIAAALGVPTVAVFGATRHLTTGPAGAHASVVRRDVECSPCLLRECPLDHRCMRAVEAPRVVEAARELLEQERRGHAD